MQGIVVRAGGLATALVSPADHVRVISPFVGGAFGSAGQTWPHQILAAFAARQMRRPVKLVLTRRQMYTGIGYRPTSRQRMAIGADRSGRDHRDDPRGPHRDRPVRAVTRTVSPVCRNSCTPARTCVPRYRVVPLDVNLPTYMRGPGATTGVFALESAMDDLAHLLGIDPIDLRLAQRARSRPDLGLPFSTRRLTECLTEGAATFGWARRNPTPRATRDGDQLIGIGMAAAGYHTSRSQSDALARVNADGTADVQSADQRHGTRHIHVDDAGRRRRARAADGQGPVRPRRQPIPQGAIAFRIADHGQRRVRGVRPRRTCCATGSIRTAVVDPGRR